MSDGQGPVGCGPGPAGSWHCAPWLPCTHPGGCLLSELAADPVADRRQRAREAGQDACDDEGRPLVDEYNRMDVAIETATRVKLTHEIVLAFIEAPDPPESDPDEIWEPLRAAFRAAGFEVESD